MQRSEQFDEFVGNGFWHFVHVCFPGCCRWIRLVKWPADITEPA